jgi:Transcriptional regulators containing a DNA-binding HTH domain and an aminotransferase domain (MocR family) and their eukaryotic orthologs
MPFNSFDNYPMSWKPMLTDSKGPLYKVLANMLEEDIKCGKLLPGTKLPPQRELADFLDINLSTVSRAFKLCEQNGFVCATIGNGTYVSSDAGTNHIFSASPEHMRMIEMGAILPTIDPNREIVEYMQKMLAEPGAEKLFQYGLAGGSSWQKEAAVKWIERVGLHTDPEQIIFSGGGQNAITAILASLFQAGDKIGTDPLVYPGIKTAAKMLGIQLVPIEWKNHEITQEGLLSACKNDRIKGLYIIPDYHNPTTHSMCPETRRMIADVAKQQHIIIIEDGINSLLSERPLPPVASLATEQTIYISSLSKAISPGLRLAYIASPPAYRKEIATGVYNMNITVAPFLLEVSARLILSNKADSIAQERRVYTKQQNEIVDRYLQQYEVYGEDCCPFRWIILPETFTGKSFEICAKNEGVQVYSGERFLVGYSSYRNAVRISVTAAKNPAEFEEGIKILKRILESEDKRELLL